MYPMSSTQHGIHWPGQDLQGDSEKEINHFFSWFSGVTFGYEGQKPLFKNLDFGIDMDSRSELVSSAWGWGARL